MDVRTCRTTFRVGASWSKTLRLDIEGLGGVLFCHGTPRSETECFTKLTPEPLLRPVFEGVDVSPVICDHTHMPFDRMIAGIRVLNAGSVGMPFGEPGADWVLLPGPDVHHRHTTYDLTHAAKRIRATSSPQAEEFVASYVLKPPSEAAMREAFTPASFK